MASGTRDSSGRPARNYWQLWTEYTINARLDPSTSRLTGRLTVGGAMKGVLDVSATLWDPDKPSATVRGGLGGHRVALLAPAR